MSAQVNQKYRLLKKKLIDKGTTINRWALAKGYPPSTVYDSAKGNRAGVEAVKIQKELEQYANA